MEYIANNWCLIVATVAVVVATATMVMNFVAKPTEEQIKQVKEWLLYAVIEAEKELGGKTGKVKLRYVFDLFVQRFPTVAKFVTFEMFSEWVDDALITMRTLLRTNSAVKELVEGE